VPYATEGPEGPLYLDFHALRHGYVALLDRTGASLKEAMQLARHGDPRLTMARYGRAQLYDLAATVARLPSLLPEVPATTTAAAARLLATGTDPASITDKTSLESKSACTALAQTGDTGGDFLRLYETPKGEKAETRAGRNSLDLQGVAAGCDPVTLPDSSSGGWDRTSDTRLMKPHERTHQNSSNPLLHSILRLTCPVCKGVRAVA
jgi:hypothetical protein